MSFWMFSLSFSIATIQPFGSENASYLITDPGNSGSICTLKILSVEPLDSAKNTWSLYPLIRCRRCMLFVSHNSLTWESSLRDYAMIEPLYWITKTRCCTFSIYFDRSYTDLILSEENRLAKTVRLVSSWFSGLAKTPLKIRTSPSLFSFFCEISNYPLSSSLEIPLAHGSYRMLISLIAFSRFTSSMIWVLVSIRWLKSFLLTIFVWVTKLMNSHWSRFITFWGES